MPEYTDWEEAAGELVGQWVKVHTELSAGSAFESYDR